MRHSSGKPVTARRVLSADGVDRFAVGRTARAGIYAPAVMCIPGGLSRPELARKLSWDDLRPGSYDPHASLTNFGMRSRKAGSTYSSYSARGSTTCASESMIFAIVSYPPPF
jgi:hypothetical protein